jgi:hypothetical protein
MAEENGTSTAEKQPTANTKKRGPGKPFVKGDPRINSKGRPKSFDALRALAQSIGAEVARDENGNQRIVEGHIATQAERALRLLIATKPEKFLEFAYGKVPQPVELGGSEGGPIVIKVVYDDPPPPTDNG